MRTKKRSLRESGVSCGQKVDFNPFLELFAATTPASLPKTLSRAKKISLNGVLAMDETFVLTILSVIGAAMSVTILLILWASRS